LPAKRRQKLLTDDETDLIGCCDLYCGLCPRFQSEAPGRCHGCKTFTFITSCKIEEKIKMKRWASNSVVASQPCPSGHITAGKRKIYI